MNSANRIGSEREVFVENVKMSFVLKGFKQVLELRVFEFDGMFERVRSPFTVSVDLALARKYGIRIQELPLLCRGVLDECCSTEDKRAYTYTEEHMCSHAHLAAEREEAAKRKKPPRRPPTDQVGAAWRSPMR